MNYFFLSLILLASVSLIPLSYAEIEKGINYDNQLISANPDGTYNYKWTSTPERILINGVYEDSRYTATDDFLILETGHGSVKLNKLTCSFDFYKKGLINSSPLFTDSIVSKIANNGTSAWNELTQITGATCETYGSNYQLVAKKYVSGVGFIEYKYIDTGTSFKTQLEATNLSTQTNKKFGFTQTIDLNRDSIKFGDSQVNLDDFSDSTFNRTWLENHQGKILNFLNDVSFDLDLGFDNLESVYVLDTGNNKSKLSFNYLKDQNIILPGNTLIIDPTFPYATGTHAEFESVLTPSCNTWRLSTVSTVIGSDANYCYKAVDEWDITTIPDTATITNVNLRYDTATGVGAPSCSAVSISQQPTVTVDHNDFSNIGNGTVYNAITCTGANTDLTVDLGTTADSDLQSLLSSNWFAVGFRKNPDSIENKYGEIQQIELEVTYITTSPPYAVTDLTSTSLAQTTANLDWSVPYAGGGGQTIIGYQINVTTPQTNNPLVFLNDTGSTNSDYQATGLTLGTSYSARVSAWTNNTGGHPFNNATGNVYNFTTTSFSPPGAPTLSAVALSDTAIRYTSIPGSAGDNATLWYNLRCELNGAGSWATIVSNSSYVSFYEYTGLTLGDVNICQWKDGSVDGFGAYSNNATADLVLAVLQGQRTSATNPDDKLIAFIEMVTNFGGVYFGLGAIPFGIMLIGFMAGKKTVRIFTIATLFLMGIIHASGYYVYPDWYWTLCLLFGIILVMGRMKSD